MESMESLCTLTERQVLTDFIQVQMKEIQRLKEENQSLKTNVKKLQNSRKNSTSKSSSRLSPRSTSQDDLSTTQQQQQHNIKNSNNNSTDNQTKFSTEPPGNSTPLLSDRISSLSGELRSAEVLYRGSAGGDVDVDVKNCRVYICALESEVELVCEEFDKKFSETVQFKNLKRMLEGKNGQLRDLRARLRLHEPDHEL